MAFPQADQIQRKKRGRPRKLKQSTKNQVNIEHKQGEGSSVPAKPQSQKRKRVSMADLYVNVEAMNVVMKKAEDIKANLADDNPAFIKTMLRSHVTLGFWLGFSREFCDDHMPLMNQTVELEDEDGGVWSANYLAEKQGLSGGWRKFAIDHKLVEGDVVVFQLVRPTKFKVYIVRKNIIEELDAALANLNVDAEDANKKCCIEIERGIGPEPEEQGGGDDDEDESKGFGKEASKLPGSDLDFGHVKSFQDFNIVTVNGSTINSQLSELVGLGYYELCCSRNSFLHQSILKDLNDKLIAGMISETVNIANAMRNAEVSTVMDDDFSTWRSKLYAFEKLGMEVGFLLTRLTQLASIFDKPKRYEKLRKDRARAAEKVANLEAQLEEAKGELEQVDAEIERLGFDRDGVQLDFVELATAPWS